MKILVCGGRHYSDYKKVKAVLDEQPITTIVHGGASGADQLAHQYAREKTIPVVVYPADWKTHGRAAGPIRNKEMLDMEAPDIVIAFPGGSGTQNMVKQAQQRNIKVIEVI
jgi:predicted Rossmann-fold nucleotide-binding protein